MRLTPFDRAFVRAAIATIAFAAAMIVLLVQSAPAHAANVPGTVYDAKTKTFTTAQGVKITKPDYMCFVQTVNTAQMQAPEAAKFGLDALESLPPQAYQQMQFCGLSDAQIIAIWNEFHTDLQQGLPQGTAIIGIMIDALSKARRGDIDPKFRVLK